MGWLVHRHIRSMLFWKTKCWHIVWCIICNTSARNVYTCVEVTVINDKCGTENFSESVRFSTFVGCITCKWIQWECICARSLQACTRIIIMGLYAPSLVNTGRTLLQAFIAFLTWVSAPVTKVLANLPIGCNGCSWRLHHLSKAASFFLLETLEICEQTLVSTQCVRVSQQQRKVGCHAGGHGTHNYLWYLSLSRTPYSRRSWWSSGYGCDMFW